MTDEKSEKKQDEIYIVCICDAEGMDIKGIYKTYKSALEQWHKVRKELIILYEKMNRISPVFKHDMSIKALKCENPDEIDNFPCNTPLIKKYKLED